MKAAVSVGVFCCKYDRTGRVLELCCVAWYSTSKN
jgi:hypothetical protein